MSIIHKTGNLFTSAAQTRVNTVNCVGVMGAGIALDFKCRYPNMFVRYKQLCMEKLIQPGRLWLYDKEPQWVLNFPTKLHWRKPSTESYLTEGLQKFLDTYQQRGITSIAFPLLGANNGKIDPERSKELMVRYLSACMIPVEIWQHDPTAPDESITKLRAYFTANDNDTLANVMNVHVVMIHRLRSVLPDVCTVIDIHTKKGIHTDIVEKLFALVR